MAEYIDKEALIKTVCYQYQGGMNTFLAKPNDFVQMVEDAPVLVLAGERHGHWEKGNLLFSICGLAKCSVCGDLNERTYYCPTCGTRMDEERKVQV